MNTDIASNPTSNSDVGAKGKNAVNDLVET